MMGDTQDDWLRVVYGSGVQRRRRERLAATGQVMVRHTPERLDPAASPGGAQRVRVTMVPSEPGLGWSLDLHDAAPEAGEGPVGAVWWRVEPGDWQPLVGVRQRVAEGRGRTRLDVELRVNPSAGPERATPRLRLLGRPA